MGPVADQLDQLIMDAMRQQDTSGIIITEEINERLTKCAPARKILELIAESFSREGSRCWGACLSRPDQTDEARMKARGLLYASAKIKEILRGNDAGRTARTS